ncbi:sensor histidine kinase [Foetidibacter luteolus]|uniref:sensor histidine kinase n=1 Tax=Foetidibacter luteolus TaxID=2608880 RepID=UPI00129ACA42|nr:sensor histidine kinase [Foetidibacter luteolus]
MNILALDYSTTDGKKRRVVLHLLFWLLFFAAQYYIGQVSFNDLKFTQAAYLNPIRVTVCLLLIYYPLVYLVVPRFFLRKKYLAATIASIVLFVVYGCMDAAWELAILEDCSQCMDILQQKQPAYYSYLQRGFENVALSRILSLGILYQLFILLSLPVGLKLALEYFRQRLASLQLEKENKELEFNFLKAQVNPHFLFNTLNNIYALILNDRKDESAETVARLASFMRYSLYQDENGNTIGKEIQLMKDYIELEKIRLNQTIINFNYEVDDPSQPFPSLLLMPVLENAFKFCMEEAGKDSWILIQLNLKQKNLYCRISNTCMPGKVNEPGGIGLLNIQKRLKHYYNGDYTFEAKKEHSSFTVNMHIKTGRHD